MISATRWFVNVVVDVAWPTAQTARDVAVVFFLFVIVDVLLCFFVCFLLVVDAFVACSSHPRLNQQEMLVAKQVGPDHKSCSGGADTEN